MSMKWLSFALIWGFLFAICLAGCGLSQDQLKRIDQLSLENDALVKKQQQVLADAKAGKLDPVAIAQSIADITAQMKKNIDEVNEIRKSGNSTAATIGAVLGLFGRSALHALAGVIPGGGVLGEGLSGLLTLALGGSATSAKKEEDPAPAKPAAT